MSSFRIGARVLSFCALGCGIGASADTPCSEATGGGVEPSWDLRIVGTGFDAYDGMRIRAIAIGGPARLGVAQDEITLGAFDLAIEGTIDDGAYVEVVLYVDADIDDACDESEALWGFVTGIAEDDLLLEVTPGELCVRDGGTRVGAGCRMWPEPFGPCYVNGGIELTMPLSCAR
jgi:hypothetical protein